MTDEIKNQLITKIKNEVHRHPDLTSMADEDLLQLISATLNRMISSDSVLQVSSINFREKRSVIDSVFEAIRGLGVLGRIIADEDITEVMINGYNNIYIEKSGRLKKLEDQFENQNELITIITKFVSQAGRMVNESEPIVDTHLNDGSRVNVVMPPVALNGPIVTIRRFPKEVMTVQKLIALGSITQEVADVLRLLVQARYNIFISGGTGSGKTTFLNALSNFIPKSDRVITIEDTAELQIRSVENLVRLETRNAGPDGSGAITIRDLIRSALRMRPDRIIVGEVRGAEALDMLQAMNTGHDGSLSTGHANSTGDMLRRLETMVLQGAESLPLEAIRQQIGSAVDVVIHLSRLRDKTRKTMEIVEILDYDIETRTFHTNVLYEFREIPGSNREKVVGKLYRTDNPMKNTYKLRAAGIMQEI